MNKNENEQKPKVLGAFPTYEEMKPLISELKQLKYLEKDSFLGQKNYDSIKSKLDNRLFSGIIL